MLPQHLRVVVGNLALPLFELLYGSEYKLALQLDLGLEQPQQELVHALPLPKMTDDQHDAEPTQRTQPKGIDPKTGKPYEPVEIPVPKLGVFERLLKRAENISPGVR